MVVFILEFGVGVDKASVGVYGNFDVPQSDSCVRFLLRSVGWEESVLRAPLFEESLEQESIWSELGGRV